MSSPLLAVRQRLEELGESALFVGEATRPWLLGEADVADAGPDGPTVRLTWDVSTDFGYAALLGRLDQLGFVRQHPREPIGKRRLGELRISVEPPVPTLVGFVSLWHQSALGCPLELKTPSGPLRVANLPHYLALELERWLTLAGEDGEEERARTFERLLALFADQEQLTGQLESAPDGLRRFVASECARWLAEEDFPATLRRLLSPGAQLSARWARAGAALRRLADGAPAAMATPPPPAVVPDAPEVPLDGPDVWRPRSGVIRKVAYDAASERLTVEFPRGAVYTYLGVPPLVFGAWRNSASAGNYHNDWIRDRYPFVRVR